MTDRTSEIKRVLITGAAGSSGRFLIDYLRREQPQVEIHGAVRRKNRVQGLEGVMLHEVDLLDTASILRCIWGCRPDAIFHAAANPDKSFECPSAVLMHNAVGTANLLEAVRSFTDVSGEGWGREFSPIAVVVSSSEVYGDVRPEDVPITEDCPMRPVSPYAVSKVACDHLGRIYHKAYGMRVVVTRAFTYLNPLRPDLFASSFAKQIAEIEAGKRDVLRHGNLESVRVMCDARDVMHAYWLAATRCSFGEAYNIGGNYRATVGEVMLKLMNLSEHSERWKYQVKPRTMPIKWEPDPALLRPVDVTLQVPDCSKFRGVTGWAPRFDIDSSLRALLDHYRREVARGTA